MSVPDFAHEDKSDAVEEAREKGGEWTVSRKRFDGSQYWVVEERTEKQSNGGGTMKVRRDDV